MLRALYEYGVKHQLALPAGCVLKTVKAFISLDAAGGFLGIEMGDSTPFVVPDVGVLAQGKDCSNVLVEKRSVVLNEPSFKKQPDGTLKVEKDPAIKHAFFKKVLADGGSAVEAFATCVAALENPDTLEDIRKACDAHKIKAGDRVSFSVDGKRIIENDGMLAWWGSSRDAILNRKGGSNEGAVGYRCMISGELTDAPLSTVKPVQGLLAVGGHGRGDAFACFDKAAFCSYGFDQALNSAMSEDAFSTARVALENLLHDAPTVAGMKFVHWYKEPVEPKNDAVRPLFADEGFDDDEEEAPCPDNTDEVAKAVANRTVQSVYSGDPLPELQNTYYILLLSAVNGRVMVRRFQTGRYEELRTCVAQWSEDLRMVSLNGFTFSKPRKLRVLFTRLLKKQKGTKNIWERLDKELPGMASSVITAILSNGVLPDAVATKALAYIRSEMLSDDGGMGNHPAVPDEMACQLLKAWILRKERNMNKEGSIMPTINENHPSKAYHCGRMMAVYADIQRKAMPDVNVNIVQRYYAACQTSPALVLGRLQPLSNHHLEKIESRYLVMEYENMLNNISVAIGDEIPVSLSLEEQAYFVLGYRQQCAEMARRRAEAKAAKEKALSNVDKQ